MPVEPFKLESHSRGPRPRFRRHSHLHSPTRGPRWMEHKKKERQVGAVLARPRAWPVRADVRCRRRTSEDDLERYAVEPVLILGGHFPNPVSGMIKRDGDTFRFDH